MKETLAAFIAAIINLLKIRSLWSLGAMGVFIWMIVKGALEAKDAMVIISMIVTFYFAKEQGN